MEGIVPFRSEHMEVGQVQLAGMILILNGVHSDEVALQEFLREEGHNVHSIPLSDFSRTQRGVLSADVIICFDPQTVLKTLGEVSVGTDSQISIPSVIALIDPQGLGDAALQNALGKAEMLPRVAGYEKLLLNSLQRVLRWRAAERRAVEFAHANEELRSNNRQLQENLADAHHRIKNSLQNVISLLNLQARKTGTLSPEQVRKLSAHIHALAVLHDLLRANARSASPSSAIPVDKVFDRLVSVVASGADSSRVETSFETALVVPKRAATLAIVFNELVSNALKHGTGAIKVTLENHGDVAILQVDNQGSRYPEGFSLSSSASRGGLALIRLLCSTDLETEPVFENLPDGFARARITFSLFSGEPEADSEAPPRPRADVVQ